jgi:hypothetical protein
MLKIWLSNPPYAFSLFRYLLSFTAAFPWYLALPQLNGRYLYLIMCRICRFMVRKKRTQKYRARIGQNTATSNTLKNVMVKAIHTALIHWYQNLNSGSRRANGLAEERKLERLRTARRKNDHSNLRPLRRSSAVSVSPELIIVASGQSKVHVSIIFWIELTITIGNICQMGYHGSKDKSSRRGNHSRRSSANK